MPNDLNLPSPNINPGIVGGESGYAPNPIDIFLQAFTRSKALKGSEDERKAQLDIQKQHLALAKEAFKLEQGKQDAALAEQAHQHDIELQRGKASQELLKIFGPTMGAQAQATGQVPAQLQGLMPQPPQGGPQPMGGQAPAQTPMAPQMGNSALAQATPQPTPNWGEVVGNMSPDAAAAFVHEDLPHLLAAQKSMNPQTEGQAVQTGDTVTTFVPGKGFWDQKANGGKGGFVPSLERHMSQDEKTIKMLQIQESRERIGAMQAYRVATQAQGQTRQFNMRTKDLQQRGAMINQALQTISDAQNNPDPQQRRVLTSSAVANFVQAADQKAQLRYQMLMYFKNNVDPSIGGKWEVLRTRMLQGTLPQYVTGGMLHHLTNLLTLTGKEYDKQRSAEVKRHPELGNWLPEKSEFFDPMTVNAQPSQEPLAPPP